MRRRPAALRTRTVVLLLAALLAAGAVAAEAQTPSTRADAATGIPCAPDDGGLTLPDGFCALVVADAVGSARHLVVAPNGDVFVALRDTRNERGGVIALRDTTGDGRADVRVRFGENGGTGIALAGDALLFATDDAVLRYTLAPGALAPATPPDTIVRSLPAEGGHRAKSIAVRGSNLYVNIGSRTNACQVQDRQPHSPGHDPCTELETRAGIWRFNATRTGQTPADGTRFATGLRNIVALAINPLDGELYGVQHGRDQLSANWPELFTAEENAEKPAEVLFNIREGGDYGWPHCFYDPELGRNVLAPEYGGDGERAGRCDRAERPLAAFPAHWAPNALAFYPGPPARSSDAFPDSLRGAAFIAFHGSWNRAPLPQGGYNVVVLPFQDGRPAGDWRVFADGFAGAAVQPRDADHRPAGVAFGPDGSLYIADDAGGRIWRVVHRVSGDAPRRRWAGQRNPPE